jgi:hypothetical protein
LYAAHLSRSRTLGTFLNDKLNAVTLFQGSEPVHFDGGMMHKNILLTPVMGDESKAFAVIEPLHGTCLVFTHGQELLLKIT